MASRRDARNKERDDSEDRRDIGPLPKVANPRRRRACKKSLAKFLKTYFPGTFRDPFSQDHLDVLSKMQRVVEDGGRMALAMPRSFGKTSMSEGAALFSILYGYRKYVVVIGAAAPAAKDIAKSIRDEIEENETLVGDFPEAIYPLQCLEGEPRRCLGQTYKFERTKTEWGQMQVKFPTMPKSQSSGAMIRIAGITGHIRGKKGKVKRAGEQTQTFRPDLVIVDDPQTESSALSEVQCRARERIINQSILGLAGKDVELAVIMPCTVMRAGDVADRHLDHKIHPEWNGSRHKMLYEWPTNVELWGQYKEIRISFNPATPGDMQAAEKRATEFYIANREAMDAGSRVAWEHGFRPGEVSAIQSCMNRHFDDPRGFAAECQNEPIPEEGEGTAPMTADQLAAKFNGLPKFHAPLTATRLTASIDIQKEVLSYSVVAWENNFTGYVVDYGAWPDQGRIYYTKADASRTITNATKAEGFEGQIYEALEKLCELILDRTYSHGAGGKIRVERCLIDANYGDSTNTVYQFCLQSRWASILLPIHGKGIGASGRPMSAWPKNPGERHDPNGMWIITQNPKRREIKYAILDVNGLKSFVYKRFEVAMASPGCLSLWGNDASIHTLIADHLTAEYPIEASAQGRTINEWKRKPNRDNEGLDTLVYNAAAASMLGVSLQGIQQPKQSTGRRKSWAEMKAEADAKR